MSVSDMGGGSSKPPPPPPPRRPPPPPPRPVEKQIKKPQVKRPSPPPPRLVEAQAKPVKDQTKPGQTQPARGPAADGPKPAPAGTASAPTGPLPPAGGQTAGGPKPPPAGTASAATDAGAPVPAGGQTAGDPKPAPAGTASARTGPLAPAGGQAGGGPKPPPAGTASAPADARGTQSSAPTPPATPPSLTPGARAAARVSSTPGGKKKPEERQAPGRPGPTEPPAGDLRLRMLSDPREQPEPAPAAKAGDSPRFDAAAALKNPKPAASDAADTQGADPPGMLHEATERWRQEAQPDALPDVINERPRTATGPTEPPATRAPDTTPAAKAPTTAKDPGEDAAGHESGAGKRTQPGWRRPEAATASPLKRPTPPPPPPVKAPAMPASDKTKTSKTEAAQTKAAGSPKPAPARKANVTADTSPPPPTGGQTAGVPKRAPVGKANATSGAPVLEADHSSEQQARAGTSAVTPLAAPPVQRGPLDVVTSQEHITIDLSSKTWRPVTFKGGQSQVVYVLRDIKTGEVLKVGKTAVGSLEGRLANTCQPGINGVGSSRQTSTPCVSDPGGRFRSLKRRSGRVWKRWATDCRGTTQMVGWAGKGKAFRVRSLLVRLARIWN